MGLLSPWFLAAGAALGLPIYLHLLRKHKTTPLKFSSLMFFERRTQSSIHHRRLQHWLLLALRVAFLLLVALAFANPFVRRVLPPAAQGERVVVLAIDDSLSMRHGDRLSRAKAQAAQLIAGWKSGDRGQVIAFGSSVRLMTQVTRDTAELRAAVEAIEPGSSRSAYAELARALRSMTGSALEVHLYSDMQRSSMPPSFADLQLPPGAKLVLHPVATSREPNWSVESVTAPRRLVDPKKTRVQATIAGYGTEPVERSVSLVVNGRALESKAVSVPSNGRASVEFLTLDAPHGFSRGEVRIDSADGLKADDAFRFAVERADPRRVLYIHEARNPRSVLYFRTALEASVDASFSIDAATPEQAANLSPVNYACVILSDVAGVPAAFEAALKKHVEAGGAVLVALGPAAATRSRVPVYGEAIRQSRYAQRQNERFQSVGPLDPTHPSIHRANRWEGVKFYQTVLFDAGTGRVVVRLADQSPLLAEKRLGAGKVLVFGSTFDNLSNDFPLHASFVPFVEQTTNYLAGYDGRPPTHLVDSFAELRTEKQRGEALEVLDPAGRRALSLEEAATLETLQLRDEGFYEIRRPNGRREVLAVNADRQESDLDVLPPETLSVWQATGEATRTAGVDGEGEKSSFRLWWYVLAAAVAVAIVESVFGQKYLGPVKESA